MAERPIRILIVDDHAVVRKGLAMVLRLDASFEVIGEANDGLLGLELVRNLKPDLVLMDLVMPNLGGRGAVAAIKAEFPQVRVLMLSGAELDENLLDVLALGVDGYVLKDIEPDELRDAIRAVASGEAYLHPAVARRVLNRLSSNRLEQSAGWDQSAGTAPTESSEDRTSQVVSFTPREIEVLHWMSTASTYREIAAELVISEETVRSHAKRILNKLGQPNRVQAVLAAVREGIIDLPD